MRIVAAALTAGIARILTADYRSRRPGSGGSGNGSDPLPTPGTPGMPASPMPSVPMMALGSSHSVPIGGAAAMPRRAQHRDFSRIDLMCAAERGLIARLAMPASGATCWAWPILDDPTNRP